MAEVGEATARHWRSGEGEGEEATQRLRAAGAVASLRLLRHVVLLWAAGASSSLLLHVVLLWAAAAASSSLLVHVVMWAAVASSLLVHVVMWAAAASSNFLQQAMVVAIHCCFQTAAAGQQWESGESRERAEAAAGCSSTP